MYVCNSAETRNKTHCRIVVHCLRIVSLNICAYVIDMLPRATYTYNNFKFMFFRAAAKRQLRNQQTNKLKKKIKKNGQHYNTTLRVPIYLLHNRYTIYDVPTPRPKCTNCSLNLFGYVVFAVVFYTFFYLKHFFFF